MPEIEDIIETTERAPIFLWWQWFLIGIGLLLVICFVWKWLVRRHHAQPVSQSAPPIHRAQRELKALAELGLPLREQASALSIILRRYLGQRYAIPALYQTREEFLSSNPNIDKLPDTASTKVRQMLDQLHQLKYAPVTDAASTELLKSTETLLISLESIPLEAQAKEEHGD